MKEKFLKKIFDFIEDIIILEIIIPSIFGIYLAWRDQDKIIIFFVWFFGGLALAGITIIFFIIIFLRYQKKNNKQK